jgi:hypothetical protein
MPARAAQPASSADPARARAARASKTRGRCGNSGLHPVYPSGVGAPAREAALARHALVHAGAVLHVAGQLTAGGVDVVAARLRTVVTTMPASFSALPKASTRGIGERQARRGNGLNGIRLNLRAGLARRGGTSAISAWALGRIVDAVEHAYSKVMKSRGACGR